MKALAVSVRRLRTILSVTRKKLLQQFFPVLYICRVHTDAMYPVLERGKFVFMKRTKRLNVNDVVLIHVGSNKEFSRISSIEGRYIYVLGDNPNHTVDSRTYGYIKKDAVVAKVLLLPNSRLKFTLPA